MPSASDDPDPSSLESMRRMAYDRSKWPNMVVYEITKYEYNKEELNQFYNELQDVIGRVKENLLCNLCQGFPKKTFILPCGCIFCNVCSKRSWNKQKQSKCPNCKQVFEVPATPFYAIDAVLTDMKTFLKEAKYFQNLNGSVTNSNDPKDVSKRLKSMHFVLLQRLKNIESQLMCDRCFIKIKKTFLVSCASDVFSYRPFCEGCDQKYIKFYEKEQGRQFQPSFAFEKFDPIVNEFYEFLENMVNYSTTSKVPTRFVSNGRISLLPIYKMIAGIIIMGFILMYYSS